MTQTSFIAVDWGSSSFRAWAVDAEGTVLAATNGPDGLKSVENRGFDAVIRAHCGTWMNADPTTPILMQGMVGARAGWHEAPYVPCPARFNDLAAHALRFAIDTHPAVILPGACMESDVMRGEEVQILGAALLTGQQTATICIPGTHCKWAELSGGALTGFSTFVSGELYQLLLTQSLVGALAQGDSHDDAAFRRGLDRGATLPLSHAVFAGRAGVLTGGLAPEEVASYLSGVLIGAECAAQGDDGPVLLLASGVLTERYAAALAHFGRRMTHVDAEAATLAGLTRAARSLWPERLAA
ncbi:2-dehydro-3-deoxygalactonokinase [Marinovum sp.]|uniref:2-dehydro-3-deoxygalactonokinase n=1 Tax=Marinovum sp. TaxID=2024839 RepID=UPI002B270D0E|nr:2-dehydro-3-deoxygalactonokinase [Marinovum sp.]